MYNNKRSVMGKWKRILVAAALTASMILALPVWNVGSAQATEADEPENTPTDTPNAGNPQTDGKLNLSSEITLNVRRAAKTQQGDIVIELYKVAGAVEDDGVDAYHLEIKDESPYASLITDLKSAMYPKDEEGNLIINPLTHDVNPDYRDLAQKAARIALDVQEETKDGKTSLVVGSPKDSDKKSDPISGNAIAEFNKLEPGLYLVIAHGAGMTPKQYTSFIDTNVEGEKAPKYGTAGQQIVTRANAGGYVYSYFPELIALPMRNTDKNMEMGDFNTSSTAQWQYNVTVELKSEQEQEMTSLRIKKEFSTGGQTVLTGPTSSVFEIEAKVGDLVVYSNTVEIASNGDGFVELKKVIPVGAVVTVTEVYAGANYKLPEGDSGGRSFTAEKDAENGDVAEKNTVSFTNNYNGNDIGGDIITNGFEPGENSWKWYKDGVETSAGSLSAPPAADQ